MKRLLLILIIGTVNTHIVAQCTKDTDCKGKRICVNGECVEAGEERAAEVDEKSALSNSMGKFMIYIDPLGVVFFGPHAGFEINVAPKSFIDVHYRHSAFGLIYNAVATEGFEWDMKMGSGAAGAGYKHYIPFGTIPHRLFLGGSLDFGWSGVKNIDDEYPSEEWKTSVKLLFIAGHAGWLWRFATPFNLGLGLIFGVAVETDADKEWAPGYPYAKEQPEKKVYPGGGVQLLLNFEFGR
ncbi:MAG: hypothetical protein JXA71_17005 [Chitinispirillaceae bacterium]|nr:hypothetical protein [Chitinispirillaceae bacterium]